MKYLYNFIGGRKLFYFNLIFLANLALFLHTKNDMSLWIPEFGYFSIALYATIVAGVETNKFIKRGRDE